MAKQAATVTVEPRSQLGSRNNKRLRDVGKIPGVIYGHKLDVVPITLPKKETVRHIEHGQHLFALAIAGKNENVLIKEVQYDHLGIEVLHVDFARVDLNEKVQLTVSLELKGEPKGEKDGGVLQQIINELQIECVVTEIPDIIIQDVSELEKDAVLHIKDLKLPSGVKVLQDGDLIVATVREILEVVETPVVVEGAAEPEIIGKKKEEGEEGEAAAAGAAAPAGEKK